MSITNLDGGYSLAAGGAGFCSGGDGCSSPLRDQ